MLRDDFDIDVRVLGITNSQKMLLSDAPIDLSNWKDAFERYALSIGHISGSDLISLPVASRAVPVLVLRPPPLK